MFSPRPCSSREARGFSRRLKPHTRFTGRFSLRRRPTSRGRRAPSCSTFPATVTSTWRPTTTTSQASSRMSPWTRTRWSAHCAPSRVCRFPRSAGSDGGRAQVGQDCKHASLVVTADRETELAEYGPDVRLDSPFSQPEPFRDCRVRSPLGHQREHLLLVVSV